MYPPGLADIGRAGLRLNAKSGDPTRLLPGALDQPRWARCGDPPASNGKGTKRAVPVSAIPGKGVRVSPGE